MLNRQYPYKDEQGELLFTKFRIEPLDGRPKNFYYERIDENGNTVRDLNGCRKVLYRLPQLLSSISNNLPIFLVEGEKDADNLIDKYLMATTTSTSLEWKEEFTTILKDTDVVILYDMDKTGLNRRDLFCGKLYGHVKRLRVVNLPGLKYKEKHGDDVSDWFNMGNTVEKLLMLTEQTPDYIPPTPTNTNNEIAEVEKLKGISIEEFLALELPPREIILSPFLTNKAL